MRRDIDRKPENALSTAMVEAEAGIRAAYSPSNLVIISAKLALKYSKAFSYH
jgi:hypothetical protein